MKRRWLVLIGILAFLAAAVLHAPADRLYAALSTRQPEPALALHGVHGTLSEGGVAGISLNRRAWLGEIDWRLRPAWLALLRLTADVEMRGDPQLQLTISRSVLGRLRLNNLDAQGTVKSLLLLAGLPPLPVEGQAHLLIDSVQFSAGLPTQVDGLAEIHGLIWTLAREPMVLGDFIANLASDDKGVFAQLASAAGPVELSGEARLALDRSWDFHLQVKPRPEATPQVLALVRSLGNPDSGGWYHLRRRGNL